MALDLSWLSPEARAYYIEIGKRYNSLATRAQAEYSLKGAAEYSELLLQHGCGPQIELLRELLAELIARGATRETVRANRKATNVAHLDAINDAKGTRLKLHSVYTITRTALFDRGDKANVNFIDAALNQTRSAGDDSDLLGKQLETLGALLKQTAIREVIAGGDDTVPTALEAEIAERLAALNSTRAEKAGPRGTPAETEEIDLIDGLIVATARNLRKAARVLARIHGKPAIAKALHTRPLYQGTKRAQQEQEQEEAERGEGSPAA